MMKAKGAGKMTMDPVFSDYLALSGPPAEQAALLAWARKPYARLPSLAETIRFVRSRPDTAFLPPFWERLVFPQVDPLGDGGADALLLLFEQGEIAPYEAYSRYPLPRRRLEEIVLARYPDNPCVLASRYERLTRRLALTLRGLPDAVLYRDGPADRRQMAALSALLASYRGLSRRLDRDNREFTDCLDRLYGAWTAYLERPEAGGFSLFLQKRHIAY